MFDPFEIVCSLEGTLNKLRSVITGDFLWQENVVTVTSFTPSDYK